MDYQEAIFYAKSGQALLFYGAGMSCDVINSLNECMPLGKGLAHKLSTDLDPSNPIDDLGYSSETYIETKNKTDLVKFLKKICTTSKTPDYYEYIAKIKWKSIFTTNYDDSLEFESSKLGISRTPVDYSRNPKNYPVGDSNIIHINGFIGNLTEESLHKNFKLTNSSYLADQFIKSPWYNSFRSEVISSKAIFFVGYSFSYDFDIAKLFFDYNEELKNKTFFITNKENIILSKYGCVCTCGVENFAIDLENCEALPIDANDNVVINFDKIKISTGIINPEININDKTYEFLTLGHQTDYLMEKVVVESLNDYAVKRIEGNHISLQHNIFIQGDLGVGKSNIAQQIGFFLLSSGYDVYSLKDDFYDPYKDIDIITKSKNKIAIIVDINSLDSEFFEVIPYILGKLKENDKFILCARTNHYEDLFEYLVYERQLIDIKSIYEINADVLDPNQFNSFLDILEKNGLLVSVLNKIYDNSRDNIEQKRKKLENDSNRQLSYLLLSLLESKHVSEKFIPVFQELAKQKDKLKILVSVFVLNLLGIQSITRKVLFDLTEDSFVLNPAFNRDEILSIFFRIENGATVAPKSTLFAKFFFSRFQKPALMVEILSELAKKSYDLKSNNTERMRYGKIYKSLATYTNIQQMFPEKDKRKTLIRYYEELRNIQPENKNPHFWLQYAIARLAYAEAVPDNNLSIAKEFLDTALSLAAQKKGYKIYDLQTQLSRYYIMHGLNSQEPSEILNSIFEAMKYLDIVTAKDKKRASFRPIKQLCDLICKNLSKIPMEDIKLFESKLVQYTENIQNCPPHVQDEPSIQIAKEHLDKSISILKKHIQKAWFTSS